MKTVKMVGKVTGISGHVIEIKSRGRIVMGIFDNADSLRAGNTAEFRLSEEGIDGFRAIYSAKKIHKRRRSR